jgi:N-methylhydantoinase B
VIPVDSKAEIALQRGDVITLAVGGGGGYGDPDQRSEAAERADLADGVTTPA